MKSISSCSKRVNKNARKRAGESTALFLAGESTALFLAGESTLFVSYLEFTVSNEEVGKVKHFLSTRRA